MLDGTAALPRLAFSTCSLDGVIEVAGAVLESGFWADVIGLCSDDADPRVSCAKFRKSRLFEVEGEGLPALFGAVRILEGWDAPQARCLPGGLVPLALCCRSIVWLVFINDEIC